MYRLRIKSLTRLLLTVLLICSWLFTILLPELLLLRGGDPNIFSFVYCVCAFAVLTAVLLCLPLLGTRNKVLGAIATCLAFVIVALYVVFAFTRYQYIMKDAFELNRRAEMKLLGKRAPNIEMPTLDGKRRRLPIGENTVLLIYRWRHDCPSCVAHVPMLTYLHHALADEGLMIVGISADALDRQKEFAERYEIPYSLLVDDGSLPEAYRSVKGMPVTFLVDKSGVIKGVNIEGVEGMMKVFRLVRDGEDDENSEGLVVPLPKATHGNQKRSES